MEPNCTNLYIKPGDLLEEIDFLIIENTLKGYASILVKTIVNNDISIENKRKSLIKYLKKESGLKKFKDMISFYENKINSFEGYKENEYGLEYISYNEKKHYYNNHYTNHSFICDYKIIKKIPYEDNYQSFEIIPYSSNLESYIDYILTDKENEIIGKDLKEIVNKKANINFLKYEHFEEASLFLKYYSLLEQLDCLEKIIKMDPNSSEYKNLLYQSLKEQSDLEKEGIKDAYLPKQLIKHFESILEDTQTYLFSKIENKERAIEIQKLLYPKHILELIRVNINIDQRGWDIIKTDDFNKVLENIHKEDFPHNDFR